MIDELTKNEIENAVNQILDRCGLVEPPIELDILMDHLKLHRSFYDLTDESLLRKFWKKVKVQGTKLIQIVAKVKLQAVWIPSNDQILVDMSLPDPKKEWASFHDLTHSVLEWHRPYFLGDTAQTLDPEYQEILEEEANYGASSFMFAGRTFKKEALDTDPSWTSIVTLKKRYKKSWVTTLRRYVQFSHDRPMAMVVSTPWWNFVPDDQNGPCRHYIGSSEYLAMFYPCNQRNYIVEIINENIKKRKGGPVGDFIIRLKDQNGENHEFRAESFYNTHYVLTFLVHLRRVSTYSLFCAI